MFESRVGPSVTFSHKTEIQDFLDCINHSLTESSREQSLKGLFNALYSTWV